MKRFLNRRAMVSRPGNLLPVPGHLPGVKRIWTPVGRLCFIGGACLPFAAAFIWWFMDVKGNKKWAFLPRWW